jgi:polyisoprenyl-phosphate glycosyltransferase
VSTPQEPGASGWPEDGHPEPERPANGRHAPPDGTVPLESLFPSGYGTSPRYDTRPAYGTPPAPGPSGDEPASYPPPSLFETMPETQRPPGTRSTPGQPETQDTPEPPAQLEPQYRGAPADGREPHVSIVLPCFNEQDHVLREVERISRVMDASGLPYELIAVDDASTDATLERLRAAEPNLPRMRIVHFPRNGGAGTVRRIGTQQAKGEIVVWTDADMTYPNDRIPEFVAMLDVDPSIDQVVGARISEAGTHKVVRVPAKWFIRKLAEKLTNSEIPDLNSGLRAFRRDVALPYLRLLPPGFSCVTTITLAFLSNEHGVVYVPIDYAKRAGVSKFRFVSDAYRYILQVLRMVMYFNPLKVLMPLALFLLGLGILKGVFDMVVHPLYFAINTVLIFVSGLIIASLALLADLIVRSRGDT